MNPFDHTSLPVKAFAGICAPIASMMTDLVPAEVNPWLQTIAFVAAIIVSVLSALSIIRQNLK
jgi:hypothetical protein